jgi:hypothetical protein
VRLCFSFLTKGCSCTTQNRILLCFCLCHSAVVGFSLNTVLEGVKAAGGPSSAQAANQQQVAQDWQPARLALEQAGDHDQKALYHNDCAINSLASTLEVAQGTILPPLGTSKCRCWYGPRGAEISCGGQKQLLRNFLTSPSSYKSPSGNGKTVIMSGAELLAQPGCTAFDAVQHVYWRIVMPTRKTADSRKVRISTVAPPVAAIVALKRHLEPPCGCNVGQRHHIVSAVDCFCWQ